ncbi:MAG: hypothetical protein SFW09_09250 [Hyphomicrobiaceae bacterium]|nr:hypothetical protein [Hyphomicrobiaceae bacterium]
MRYNVAARFAPWLVLRDGDGVCPALLVGDLLPAPAAFMRFRVVVPAIEAWLMADRQAWADTLDIALDRIPENPEAVVNIKDTVLRAAALSRLRSVRDDFLPTPRSGRREGRGYASRLIDFIETTWNPMRASRNSDSLRRALARLDEVVKFFADGR